MEIIGQNYWDDQISIFLIFLFFLFIYIKWEKWENEKKPFLLYRLLSVEYN